MPYLDDETKTKMQSNPWDSGKTVGELTYKLTSNLACFLDCRLMEEDELCYADLTECLAALESAKADFIERILLPYEACKHFTNGDVWGGKVIHYVHHA